MPSRPAHTIALACHPGSSAAGMTGVSARLARHPDGLLELSYVIDGDIGRLRVPAERAPSGRVPTAREARVADRLWEHTCCEIFIACRGLSSYHELNFSPSGEWAVYAFERYRRRAAAASPDAAALAPRITVRRTAARLELDAAIRLERLSPAHRDAALALALAAVIEDRDGTLSYWALRHPPGRPDFHHADGYALELGEARASSAPAST